MYRILIGCATHETNTFWPKPTGLQEFKNRTFLFGPEIPGRFRGTHSPLGAFIEALEAQDVEIVYSIAAGAMPSGTVTKEAFDFIRQYLVQSIQDAGHLDGILLQLHGAMETDEDEDGEGCLLEAVRTVAGRDIPVVATLDLHANISARMTACANAFFPYREYPHSDMYDRGLDAARAMMRMLDEGMKPAMCCRHVPVLASLVGTTLKEYRPIREVVDRCEATPGVLEATLAHGFFMTDARDAIPTALVVTDGDAALAEKLADEIAACAWKYRDVLAGFRSYTPDEAIPLADACDGLAILADVCDNPGAGSSSDGTNLLRALLAHKVRRAAVAAICDAETVATCHAAGVGATIDIRLGGKTDPALVGEPIPCRAYVKTLSDGVYINRGPMSGGVKVDLQKSAVIVVDGVTIIVSSVPTQAYDIEIFQSHGLMLHDFKMLVLKSSVHFRAAFEPHSSHIFPVNCPGGVELDASKLPYRRRMKPLYPLETTSENPA